MSLRLILGGMKSYLPLPQDQYKGTGGTVSGAYCYTVWLRHLSLIHQFLGGVTFDPKIVVELGPGDSIGLGLAALLTGAELYTGLDVLEHSTTDANYRVLDELVLLFRARAKLPDEKAFSRLYPRLRSYEFPDHLLNEVVLRGRLSDQYVSRLGQAIENAHGNDGLIRYRAPWNAKDVQNGSADLIISQGALQDMDHTPRRDNLRDTISTITGWLKPGGVMSHHIELSCPGGREWNHHWAYNDFLWKVVRGRRPYYKNRVPLSQYITLFEQAGCRIIGIERLVRDGLPREATAEPFRQLPEGDFHTAAALLAMVKL